MEIEQHVRTLKLSEIEEIIWLKLRNKTNTLHQLELSIRPCAPPATPSNGNSLEELMLRLSVGQLAPIRVLRYPLELHHYGPPYGLIFGYRRYQATKKANLDTIQAQVIHLTAQEYDDPTVRLMLLLMAFAENAHREPLSSTDYYHALQRLKDKYESIFPAASRRFKHLTQAHNHQGQFAPKTRQNPPSFTKLARTITGKDERRIREDIQLADIFTRALLQHRYEQPITKSALLTLNRISPEQQTAVLQQLESQHLPPTVENIEQAIARSRRAKPQSQSPEPRQQQEKPTLTLPDLHTVKTVTKLCLDLRNNVPWTPAAVQQALPIFTDLVLASQTLTDYLKQQAVSLQQ
jgi:hypothetical protein